LTSNYAPYPDGNVPRQGLYFSYRRVCDQYGIPHINTATLGKAIRLCFPTIKTRRLGVRGNSKYHCESNDLFCNTLPLIPVFPSDCGIRPATSAEAEWLQEYIHKSNNNAGQPSINAARLAQEQADSANRGEERSDEDDDEDSEGATSAMGSKRNSLTLSGDMKNGSLFAQDLSDKTPTAANLLSQAQASQRATFPLQASIRRHPQQDPGLSVQSHSPPSGPVESVPYLATAQPISVRQFPHFPSIDDAVGSNSTTSQALAAREVWGWFQDHLDALLESVRNFRFDQFEMHLRTFWTGLSGNHREVVHAPAIAGLMAKADAIVYDVRRRFLILVLF
jgi:regulatory factor X